MNWSKNSALQSYLILGLAAFFIGHFTLLSPSNLEDDFTGMRVINPKDLLSLLRNEADAPSTEKVPLNTPPSYSLRDATLFSSEGASPGFKLLSRKTNTYQKEELSELRDVLVELHDGTQVSAKTAIHDLKKGQIEFIGEVLSRFSSGAEIKTRYLLLILKPVSKILIPKSEEVTGSQSKGPNHVQFSAKGMEYVDTRPGHLELLSEVRVRTRDQGGAEIQADTATFSMQENKLRFGMNDRRPIADQFVHVLEPALRLKSRILELDFSNERDLERILATQDVWFQDSHDPARQTIGTGGSAVYSTARNEILLTEFPQLYQDNDTITGDSIIFHRDTDSVEVRQSNAIYDSRSKKTSH